MHTHSDTPASPAFLTVRELATRWKVTPMTLRRYRKAGKIKTSHIGGVRFTIAEIERYEREAAV